jgi:hypothetical protein
VSGFSPTAAVLGFVVDTDPGFREKYLGLLILLSIFPVFHFHHLDLVRKTNSKLLYQGTQFQFHPILKTKTTVEICLPRKSAGSSGFCILDCTQVIILNHWSHTFGCFYNLRRAQGYCKHQYHHHHHHRHQILSLLLISFFEYHIIYTSTSILSVLNLAAKTSKIYLSE